MGGVRGADRDLVLACKAGQTGAWDRLVAKYERLVFSIPRSYGLSREDAADVSQAAFIALIGGLDSLTEESHVKAWLATLARRHTWRLMGRGRREGTGAGRARRSSRATRASGACPRPRASPLHVRREAENGGCQQDPPFARPRDDPGPGAPGSVPAPVGRLAGERLPGVGSSAVTGLDLMVMEAASILDDACALRSCR
jgi:hypothetical protein